MSNGTDANIAGKILQNFVKAKLDQFGYVQVKPKHFLDQRCSKPIYAEEYTEGSNIYKKRRRVDFILYHPEKWRDCLVIQCKWQSSQGTAEEKYPFEVMSIAANPYPTIIILDGGGYSKGAEEWLRAQTGEDNLLLHVFNQGEFARFGSQGKL